ncbi:MAG: Alginate biosynthesis protein AlgA [Chlamydiae bacterium]|nr:Alginate biosynthesis protein AlgA [Chlamydiota bacterium]
MKILILAGGCGTRLWPHMNPPKPFFLKDGTHTLLQKTLLRFIKTYPAHDLVILTQKAFAAIAREQADAIAPEIHVLAEPEKRNTAPALLYALQHFEDEFFFVTPSDLLIAPENLFLEKLHFAKKNSETCSAVLFGIYPTSPNTDFGYIKCDPEKEISPVEKFLEKPSLSETKSYLESGNWLWNSGMLLFHRNAFFAELEKILKGPCPALSIDHAFLENFKNLCVMPLALSWSDVGTWDAVYEAYEKDESHNVIIGDVSLQNTKNSLILGESRPIKAIDVEDLLIVDSEEGLLVSRRQKPQSIPSKEFSMNSLSQ